MSAQTDGYPDRSCALIDVNAYVPAEDGHWQRYYRPFFDGTRLQV
jgi:hypothetical protein